MKTNSKMKKTRKCSKCDRRKLNSQFVTARNRIFFVCKACTVKRQSQWAHKNPSSVAASHARSNMKRTAYKRIWARAHGKSMQSSRAKWLANNPEKRKAHNTLNNALRDGKIKRKPCEFPGCKVKSTAHHDDYSKPLKVRWLCWPHHKLQHRKYKHTTRKAA